jgi:hypothetical protein
MAESAKSPRDAFLEFQGERFKRYTANLPDYETVERLRAIATGWREASQHFYAGYVLHEAVHFAWGDGQAVDVCVSDAIGEFETAVRRTAVTDLEGIAALRMWTSELGMNYLGVDPLAVRDAVRALNEELAQRLLALAAETEEERARAGLLVRGFRLATEYRGRWDPEFVESEIDSGVIQYSVGSLVLNISSAFHIFVRGGDYLAADSIVQTCPEAFTSYGLRGWRAAVAGFLHPEQAVDRFTEAADEFARDTYDEEMATQSGNWSSINIDLWAKYFRARAAVAEIVRTPERATELLRSASAALTGTESGWVNPQVTCFRIVVNSLDQIFDGDIDVATAQAKETLLRNARFSGFDEDDRLAVEFLDAAAKAFTEVQLAPATAMVSGRLPAALEALGRITLIGNEVASAIRPAVGQRAHTQLLGQERTWIYRTIESIKDEASFSVFSCASCKVSCLSMRRFDTAPSSTVRTLWP